MRTCRLEENRFTLALRTFAASIHSFSFLFVGASSRNVSSSPSADPSSCNASIPSVVTSSTSRGDNPAVLTFHAADLSSSRAYWFFSNFEVDPYLSLIDANPFPSSFDADLSSSYWDANFSLFPSGAILSLLYGFFSYSKSHSSQCRRSFLLYLLV